MRRARVVLVIALAAASVPARAQTEPAPAYQSTVHARPRRENDRATIVMTARELAERNVQNLAEALDLVPELQVRQGGNGIRLDLRGAKQRSILLLIDGVPLDEPYFGAFDLSAIPITDIVEIRVQLSPASPLEGPGGDGGIVEVFTLRAVGGRRLQARVVGATDPDAEGALTGRLPLGPTWGLRVSTGARFADPGYPVVGSDGAHATFFDRQTQAYASARLERASAGGRFTVDGWYGHRAFVIPPSDTTGATLQDVTAEDAARLVVGGELALGRWRLGLGGYGEYLGRATDFFSDYTLRDKTSHQDLQTGRTGAALNLERPFQRGALRGSFDTRFSVDGEGAHVVQTGVAATDGFSSYAELAAGAKLRWRVLRGEAAVGGLVPLDHPAGAWPEAKLALALEPNPFVSLTLTGARKGRLPTVRELYDPLQGNARLGPEQTWHAEARLDAHPHPLVAAHATAYLRRVDGMIRLDQNAPFMSGRNVNLDTVDVRGLEAGIEVAPGRVVGGGVTYLFEDASSASLGTTPIPNFPRHRVDAFLSTTLWRRRLGGLVRFRYVDDRLVQGVTLAPYELVDLTVWGRITGQIRASLRINNLLDARYQQLPGLPALGTNAILTVEGAWE